MKKGMYFELDCKQIEICKQNDQLVIRFKANLYHSQPQSPASGVRIIGSTPDVLAGLNQRYATLYKSNIVYPQPAPQDNLPPQTHPLSNSMVAEEPNNKTQSSTNPISANQSNNVQYQNATSGNQSTMSIEPTKTNIFSVGTNNPPANTPIVNNSTGNSSFRRNITPTMTQPSATSPQDNIFSRQSQQSGSNLPNMFSQQPTNLNNSSNNQQRGSSNMFISPGEHEPSIFTPTTTNKTLSESRGSTLRSSRQQNKMRIQ